MKSYVAGLVLLVFPGVLSLTRRRRSRTSCSTRALPKGKSCSRLVRRPTTPGKISLAEDFLAKYPKHEAAGWVAAQLESGLLAQKDNDKVLEVAEAAYANGPDMDAAYFALKAAVAKEDVAEAKKWSARTSEAARKITSIHQNRPPTTMKNNSWSTPRKWTSIPNTPSTCWR
jgi:hypothetical protein